MKPGHQIADPFEEPFIAYHLNEALEGNYESARWLRDNARRAMNAGRSIDPILRLELHRMRKGGLRKAVRRKPRGKRGKARGDQNQLLLAREMWKLRRLAGFTMRQAADRVAGVFHRSSSSAISGYYRFTCRPDDRRDLLIELKCDYLACPESWAALARTSRRLNAALRRIARSQV